MKRSEKLKAQIDRVETDTLRADDHGYLKNDYPTINAILTVATGLMYLIEVLESEHIAVDDGKP